MLVHFHKYQGTGNDFILVDERFMNYNLINEQIRFMCDRRFGIGADGLMLLQSDATHHFRMIYYNSDGNESTMCGNGGRCMISFARELGLITEDANFIAIDGVHEGKILGESLIRLKMNDVLNPSATGNLWFLDTGSPHVVCFIEETDNFPVYEQGRKIRNMPEFQPGGTNVDFVKITETGLWVRSYERGVEDETLSCGTGVTASVITWVYLNQDVKSPVEVITRGGKLSVSFNRKNGHFTDIWLEGPAVKVFNGEILL